jgi:hypothetical protein
VRDANEPGGGVKVNVRKRGRQVAQAQRTDAPTVLRYGTATGTDEVDGIPMQAITSVSVGQKVAYLQAGGDRLILGPVS